MVEAEDIQCKDNTPLSSKDSMMTGSHPPVVEVVYRANSIKFMGRRETEVSGEATGRPRAGAEDQDRWKEVSRVTQDVS